MNDTGTAPADTHRTHGHIAGLDGLRGIAVAAVLMFHLWPRLLPGGFVGVTVFFALSGYLITTMLLHELGRDATINLRRFYSRRIRRLLPASLATLACVAVVWNAAGWMTRTTGNELLASALNVANWQRILTGQAYGVDAEASPVLHFWSLAIEEQAYLVLPVLLLASRTRRRAVVVLTAALAASLLYTITVSGQSTVTYYSSFTRVAELLAGALVAALMFGRAPSGRAARTVATGVGVTGALILGLAFTSTSLGTEWYYRGGLAAAGLVAALTVAAIARSGRLAAGFDHRALRWLGHRSYGVYLFHWPLLVALRNSGLSASMVPWVTLAGTLSLAAVSYARFEQPIRLGTLARGRFATVMAGFALIVPVAAFAVASPAAATTDFSEAKNGFERLIADTDTATATAGAEVTTPAMATPGTTQETPSTDMAPSTTQTPQPLRVGFFGDSKALTLGLGLGYNGPDIVTGPSITQMGCPLARVDHLRPDADKAPANVFDSCDWTDLVASGQAGQAPLDTAVVWFGTWDIREMQVPALGNRWTTLEDPQCQQWLLSEMLALTDELTRTTGASRILWLTLYPDPAYPHQARVDAYNNLLELLAAQRPTVEVADIAGWVASTGDDARLLPDHVHPTWGAEGGPNSAEEIGRRWLTDLLLAG